MSAKTKIYIPNETTSNSVGSNDINRVISSLKGFDEVEIIRNGSWGAFWLEPFIEVEKDGDRRGACYKGVDIGSSFLELVREIHWIFLSIRVIRDSPH